MKCCSCASSPQLGLTFTLCIFFPMGMINYVGYRKDSALIMLIHIYYATCLCCLKKMLSFVTLKMLAEHTLAVKHLGAPTLSPVKTDLIISPACPYIWMPADLQIKHAVCSGGTSFYLTDTHIDWELIVLLRLQCPLGQWVIEWVGGGQHKHLASPKNKFQSYFSKY